MCSMLGKEEIKMTDEPIKITKNEKIIYDFCKDNPNKNLTEIKEATEFGGSTVTRLVNNLKDKGVITKKLYVVDGEVDGRAIIVEVKKDVKFTTD